MSLAAILSESERTYSPVLTSTEETVSFFYKVQLNCTKVLVTKFTRGVVSRTPLSAKRPCKYPRGHSWNTQSAVMLVHIYTSHSLIALGYSLGHTEIPPPLSAPVDTPVTTSYCISVSLSVCERPCMTPAS